MSPAHYIDWIDMSVLKIHILITICMNNNIIVIGVLM